MEKTIKFIREKKAVVNSDIIVSFVSFTPLHIGKKVGPLRHRGFHNSYDRNRGYHNGYKFMCSRYQLQIDQVILCLKPSVNQQGLPADNKT